MNGPRIGLFTFYTGNFGAALQAYATQQFIRGTLERDCTIVRTRPGTPGETPLTRLILRGELFHGTLGKIRRRLRRKPPAPRYFKEGTAQRAEAFRRFEQNHLILDDNPNRLYTEYYKNPPDYDVYLSGSDQVWNPLAFSRCNPVYYLDFAPEGRPRVSYASSFAVSEIPRRYRREMKRFLTRFNAVSVRETEGAGIVEGLTGTRPPVVVDPTFLLTGDRWRALAERPAPEEPYVLFYRLGKLPYFGAFREYILKATGLKPVVVPARPEDDPKGEADYTIGPLDLVNLIARAALTVTDSFHGAALSINLGTPFYALLRQDPNQKGNMNSRILSLLERLNLTGRLITPGAEPPKQEFFTPPAPAELHPWRDASAEYLADALQT
ncbi:MAG: polysaccharide pyruvyl transferase family protein [Thermoguttaceae bacterium]|nr:polysaccharide pyruvyl transferase family protein [Thermoguttaceae bacterium]